MIASSVNNICSTVVAFYETVRVRHHEVQPCEFLTVSRLLAINSAIRSLAIIWEIVKCSLKFNVVVL